MNKSFLYILTAIVLAETPGLDLKRYECLISRQCACRIPITPSSSPPSSNHLHKRDIFIAPARSFCFGIATKWGVKKNSDLKEIYNKIMKYFYGCPQSQTRKRLDLALGLAGLDSLPDAANNVRRSTSAYKQSAKRREAQTRISQHKTHNRTCTHAQTRRLSRNWTDRTRLATLAPHLTSAKSDTSKGQGLSSHR